MSATMTDVRDELDELYEPHALTSSEELTDAEATTERADTASFYRSANKRIQRMTNPQAQLAERARLIAEACGVHPVTDLPYYTPEQIGAELRVREEEGYARPHTGPVTLMSLFTCEQVPNLILRAEFLRQHEEDGLTSQTVAEHIGEMRQHATHGEVGDGTRVERLLGMAAIDQGEDAPVLRLFIPAETAAKLADALGMTYQDAGI